jgi:L,D-transpeptidase ErfK/SrfK
MPAMVRMLHVALAAVVSVSVPASADSRGDSAHMGRLSGGITVHAVVRGENLTRIGSTFGVDASTLAADNHLDVRAPLTVGQRIRIDNRHIVPVAASAGRVVINIPQRMLFFSDDLGHLDASPVAVGRPDWQTPTAPFTVIIKKQDPTWHVPASILRESAKQGRTQPPVVPPGPGNPLGAFWVGLSVSGIGIHGTTAPASIYHAATHGCIRLGSADIRRLFTLVDVGAAGRIIYEPILLAEVDGEVYLEVHKDIYSRLTVEPVEMLHRLAIDAALVERIDWTVADAVLAARQGVARVVTPRSD